MNESSGKSSVFTRRDVAFVAVCWFCYTAAYFGRYNLTASILTMMDALGWTKSDIGVVSGMFFIAYGCGQLVNGIASRFYNPKWMMAVGLAVSGAMNLLVPVFPTQAAMRVIWCLNGCAQSVLWCCIVKTFAQYVSEKAMASAVVVISTTYAAGIFASYGAVAAFSRTEGSWTLGFSVPGVVLLLASAVWIFVQMREGGCTAAPAAEKKKSSTGFRIVFPFVAFGCASGLLDGFLKDGLSSWVPSVLFERFGVDATKAIMLTLGMSLLSVVGSYLNKKAHERFPVHGTMMLQDYAITTALAVLMIIALRLKLLWLLVPAAALSVLFIVMVNNIITSLMILNYRRCLDVGLIAGIMDTFCYVGTSLATGGLGFVADGRGGWTAVFFLFLAAAAVGTVVSQLLRIAEKKLMKTV